MKKLRFWGVKTTPEVRQEVQKIADQAAREGSWVAVITIVLLLLGLTIFGGPAQGQENQTPAWATKLNEGVADVRDWVDEQFPPAERQAVIDRTQAAFQEGLAAVQQVQATCEALNEGMKEGPFGQNRRWAEIVAQLQENVASNHPTASESAALIRELVNQVRMYDQNLTWREKWDFNPRLEDPAIPPAVDAYFRIGSTKVCQVMRPGKQLQRFKRVQEVLLQSNPRLALKVMVELGPYLAQAGVAPGEK